MFSTLKKSKQFRKKSKQSRRKAGIPGNLGSRKIPYHYPSGVPRNPGDRLANKRSFKFKPSLQNSLNSALRRSRQSNTRYPYPLSKTKAIPYFKRDSTKLLFSSERARKVAEEHASNLYMNLGDRATQIYDIILKAFKRGTLLETKDSIRSQIERAFTLLYSEKKILLSKLNEFKKAEEAEKSEHI